MGGFVRLLGFTTLGCGCIVGRYRELATNRDVNYVEEKGDAARRTVTGEITQSPTAPLPRRR